MTNGDVRMRIKVQCEELCPKESGWDMRPARASLLGCFEKQCFLNKKLLWLFYLDNFL